jgi:hypothetical protein
MFNAFLDTYLNFFLLQFSKKSNTTYSEKEWLDYLRNKNIM